MTAARREQFRQHVALHFDGHRWAALTITQMYMRAENFNLALDMQRAAESDARILATVAW